MEKNNQKMTMQDINVTYARLSGVVKAKKVFSGEMNLAIAKNTLMLEAEIKNFEKSKETLIDKYVLKDENGNLQTKEKEYVFATDEDKAAYIQGVEELLEAEIEVEIHKADFKGSEDDKRDIPTPADLIAMDFMLNY